MTTNFTIRHRYGLKEIMKEINEKTLTELIDELRIEKFEVPDEEHTQVSIENPRGHILTLYRDGLLRLEKETARGFEDLFCAIEDRSDALIQAQYFITSTQFPSNPARWFKTEQDTPLKPHKWLDD